MQGFVDGIHQPADGGGDDAERNVCHLGCPAEGHEAAVVPGAARRREFPAAVPYRHEPGKFALHIFYQFCFCQVNFCKLSKHNILENVPFWYLDVQTPSEYFLILLFSQLCAIVFHGVLGQLGWAEMWIGEFALQRVFSPAVPDDVDQD